MNGTYANQYMEIAQNKPQYVAATVANTKQNRRSHFFLCNEKVKKNLNTHKTHRYCKQEYKYNKTAKCMNLHLNEKQKF